MEEFVNDLGLPFEGIYSESGTTYTIKLDNSNDWSQLFIVISTNKDLDVDEDSEADESKAHFVYSNDTYEIDLTADFDNDEYTAVISER